MNNLSALQTFDEHNMDPMRVPLKLPRRQLPSVATELIQPKLENLQVDNTEEEQDQEVSEQLLKISNLDCWLLHGYMAKVRESDKQKLRTLFPCSFRWLLDTCAATIGIEWEIVYEQLLVIEVMFHHGIEDWNNHSNHLSLKYNMLNKDISSLTKTFRDMW